LTIWLELTFGRLSCPIIVLKLELSLALELPFWALELPNYCLRCPGRLNCPIIVLTLALSLALALPFGALEYFLVVTCCFTCDLLLLKGRGYKLQKRMGSIDCFYAKKGEGEQVFVPDHEMRQIFST
jgi:hypothetical protein